MQRHNYIPDTCVSKYTLYTSINYIASPEFSNKTDKFVCICNKEICHVIINYMGVILLFEKPFRNN